MLKFDRPSPFPILAAFAAAVALLLAPATAGAVDDRSGVPIPNTDPGSTSDLVSDGPVVDKWLAAPETPDDDDTALVDSLCCPGDPETDLFDALDDLEDAPDSAAAQAAIDRALAILEGAEVEALDDKAYQGIPLLNWNAPLKTKAIEKDPAGNHVDVTEVRFGDHVLRDTWMLEFPAGAEDEPFTVTYRTAELRAPEGAALAPAPLLADDQGPLGGVQSAVHPLALPRHETGTRTASRFVSDALGGREVTRTAVQEVEVEMPPPGTTHAILEPPISPRTAGMATLRPATPGEADAARQAAGFAGEAPTEREKDAAIAELSNESPEKQIWSDLQGLNPVADLGSAKAIGGADKALVATMRTRSEVPTGVVPNADADVTVVIQNNEIYLGRREIRPEPGQPVRVQVVNRDEAAHDLEVLGLSGRREAFGALDLGTFDHDLLRTAPIPANGNTLVTVNAGAGTSGLVVGDPDAGDQASGYVAVDRGPRRESFAFEGSSDVPLHGTEDQDGNVWMTVEGTDRIARLTPAENLADSQKVEFDLDFTDRQGRRFGVHDLRDTDFPLAPHDIAVDPKGILWATLTLGNAIVRIDPAKVGSDTNQDGKDDGMRFYPLDPCEVQDPELESPDCAQEFPVVPNSIPSRGPLQMETQLDGEGNTVVWFVNSGSNEVGALRVAPDGTPLTPGGEPDVLGSNLKDGYGHRFTCGSSCTPLGIDIDGDGSVWFSEGDANRIGHLIPDQAEPYKASAATVDHYDIPTGTTVIDPLHPAPGVCTSLPHSVEIDPEGRVWYTGEATGRVGFVDPAKAQPSTGRPARSEACLDNPPAVPGFQEITPPHNDFQGPPAPADMAVDRAGTIYWADEYGDVVGRLDHEGPSPGFRPTERRSLTDSPFVTSNGDLWFLEAGSNLLTRISGVTAGAPRPAAPPALNADPTRDTLSGEGLRGVSSVDVEVVRGGSVVATASLPVQQRAFAVGRAAWTGSGQNPLEAGDEVRVTTNGEFLTRPLVFRVADLTAAVQADGSLDGQALRDGKAVAGSVNVNVAAPEPAEGSARIEPVKSGEVPGPSTIGTFTFTAAEALAPHSRGNLSWSQGTIAATFTTTSRFGPADTTPPAAPSVTPGGGLFFGPLDATLASDDADARIFYTTDGSSPTESSSSYIGPVRITGSQTLRAVAIDSDDNRSGVASAGFKISPRVHGLAVKQSMTLRQATRDGIRASFEAPRGARFFEARLLRVQPGPDRLYARSTGRPKQSPQRHSVTLPSGRGKNAFVKGSYVVEVRLAETSGAALRPPVRVSTRLR